jgi:hydroxyethylthiazole kinase-like uncharacterized protein yjeF
MIRRVLPVERDFAIFSASQTRAIEQRSSSLPLMRRAGESAARLALAIAPHARSMWIAAGPGNNGGDGLEAAIHLLRWGKRVQVSLIGDAGRLPADAAAAFARAQAAGVTITSDVLSISEPPQLAIDALLGIGASRSPQGPIAECIRQLNALACPVLAIDLPSGLHPDTGQPLGLDCVIAAHTLTMLTLKAGLFTASGRDHSGEVWLDTLEVSELDEAPSAANAPMAWLTGDTHASSATPRRHAQHKGSFGDVAVVGGAHGMSGAAFLAARAAHAAGAGRVYVELLDDSPNAPTIDWVHPELMFRHGWSRGPAEVLARSTVVCGCGGSDAVRAVLPRLLSRAMRLVLDADALNAIASDPALQTLLIKRQARGLATVLTPHPLEAARLLAVKTAEVQADRVHAARGLADRFACTVVLKGSGTVIAAPNQVPRINSTGNAALATAGTGDVLAGWLGGLWAQRSTAHSANAAPGEAVVDSITEQLSAFESACQAVSQHGAASEPQPRGPLRATDLIERLYNR